jgi:hypothetical protein
MLQVGPASRFRQQAQALPRVDPRRLPGPEQLDLAAEAKLWTALSQLRWAKSFHAAS